MSKRNLKIGTRGSPLALAQAHMVKDALEQAWPDLGTIDIHVIKTTGDHILDRALSEAGGKGLFTKEIEESLYAEGIDLAVHSMKDMPTQLPDGLVIGAMLPREDPRDALIAGKITSIADLPEGARVGTASLRREAQLLAVRPDIKTQILRGSVNTRLRKIEEGEVDATFLAMAGLKRLGLEHAASAPLEIDEMLPAVAQGAVGIECRMSDTHALELIAAINDEPTTVCVDIERVFLAGLDGSCRTPIAGYATLDNGNVIFRGLIAKPDGTIVHRVNQNVTNITAEAAIASEAESLKKRIGDDFLHME